MTYLSKTFIGGTALAFGLVLAAPGFAQDKEHGQGYGHGKDHGQHRPVFEHADKDGDGVLSREEFMSGHQRMFSAADADGDGALTAEERSAKRDEIHIKMEERRAKMEERRAERQEMRETHRKKMLEEVDADGDGTISAAEHDAHLSAQFARMDKNGDGKISADELPKRGQHKEHKKR